MIGRVVGSRYCILRQLGEGGMGIVYEAADNRTGLRVALKVLINRGLVTDREARMRFEREARAARAIDTRHIVRVLDAGADVELGQPFLVMELMSGADLEQLVQQLAPLPPDLMLRIAAQACVGLASAHAAGIIHRDVKPANLYLSRQDNGAVVVKIADFGIAKLSIHHLGVSQDHALTQAGGLLGSPLFMSPEQARGQKNIDHRTDLWSLGAVMYQGLAGRAPHHGIESVGQLLITICSEPAEHIQDVAPWIAPEIAAIVHRALAIEADQRFSSAVEMLDALAPLLPGGFALNEWMLAPLPFEARAGIAPRFSPLAATAVPPSPRPGSGWPSSRARPSSTAPQIKDVEATQQALTRTTGSARSSRGPLALGAILVLGSAVVWKMTPPRPTEPAAATSALGSAPSGALPEGRRSGAAHGTSAAPAASPEPIVTPIDSSAVPVPRAPSVLRDGNGRTRQRTPPKDDETTQQIARPDPGGLGTRRIIRRTLE
ncbi:MAG TPA: protein kinase [Polyangiaceae bacterium]